jgi:hypothetical protein
VNDHVINVQVSQKIMWYVSYHSQSCNYGVDVMVSNLELSVIEEIVDIRAI